MLFLSTLIAKTDSILSRNNLNVVFINEYLHYGESDKYLSTEAQLFLEFGFTDGHIPYLFFWTHVASVYIRTSTNDWTVG